MAVPPVPCEGRLQRFWAKRKGIARQKIGKIGTGLLKKSHHGKNLSAVGGRPTGFSGRFLLFAGRAPSPDDFFNSPTGAVFANAI
jgi:hypothetical protein